jgi:D-alanine-D-alanine ligase
VAGATGRRFRYLDDHGALLSDLAAAPPAFVLNFCDTGFRNRADQELHLPALLEFLGVPYSGAPPACLALCYDKAAVRGVAAGLGVLVPDERFVRPDEPAEAALPERLPVLVKPNRGDGSIGITQRAVARTPEEALACVERLRAAEPACEVLVQEFLEGAEYGIGLIGNPGGFRVLPPMEVDFSRLPEGLPPILSYESKADPESPYYTDIDYRQAKLEPEVLEEMVARSERLFARLGCRDYARFDFRAGADGRVRLLEVNPNPAWCWDGKMAFMAGFAGIGCAEMLGMILEAAEARTA